jgi:RNA methyltransferase, TrmH family
MLGKSKTKYIQSLGQKKARDEEGLFIAEGPRIIAELLAENRTPVREIYALQSWTDEHASITNGITITVITEDELGRISQLSTPNQVVALVEKGADPLLRPNGQVSLALDGIQDPGNLGTIIRIADWFGIDQIICSPDCADQYNPKVVQATMGSIARVQLQYTDLVSWHSPYKGIPVYAAALNGKDIATVPAMMEGVIIIGNESKGIRPQVMELATDRITIPKKGKAESLNAAVATGIILAKLVG